MALRSNNVPALDKAVLQRYLNLPQPDNKVMATYIWIDGSGENLRGIVIVKVNFTSLMSYFFLVKQRKQKLSIKNH